MVMDLVNDDERLLKAVSFKGCKITWPSTIDLSDFLLNFFRLHLNQKLDGYGHKINPKWQRRCAHRTQRSTAGRRYQLWELVCIARGVHQGGCGLSF